MLDAFANKALSEDAHDILDRAFEEARLLNAQTVSSIHLLLVFFDGKAAKYLRLFGKPLHDIRDAIKDATKAKSIEGDPTIDEELYELVNEAIRRASLYGLEKAYTCHLFRALMTDATWSDKAFALMKMLKLDIDQHRLEADLRVKVFTPEVAEVSAGGVETENKTESESVVAAAASLNESSEVTQAPARKLPFYDNPSDYFSDATRELLQAAYRYAEDDRGSLVELSHLLRAFVYTSDPTISKLFTTCELRQAFARIALRVQSPLSTAGEPLEDLDFSTDVHLIIGTAFKDSRLFLRDKIEPRDVLLAILSEYETRSLCAAFEFDEVNGLLQAARRQILDHSESRETDQATTYEGHMGDAILYLTKRAYSVLVFAKESALQSRSPIILPAHLMLGVLRQAEHSEAGFVLARAADVLKVRELLDRRYGLGVASEHGAEKLAHFGYFARNVLRDARFQAKQMNIHTVDLHHLALALIRHAPDLVAEMSVVADLNVIALRKRIESCMMLQHQQWTNLGAAILQISNLDSEIFVDSDALDENLEHSSLSSRTLIERVLSPRSESAISTARVEATLLAQSEITLETLMLGLLDEISRDKPAIIWELGIDLKDVKQRLRLTSVRNAKRRNSQRRLNHHCWVILEYALEMARKWRAVAIDPEHILLALTNQSSGFARLVFETVNLDAHELQKPLMPIIREQFERTKADLETSTP